jgi:Outer membrane receptor proteins, mostly Fe transport
MRKVLLIILVLMASLPSFAQKYTFSGSVLEKGSNTPVEFATVVLLDKELWAVADEKGAFVVNNVTSGKTRVEISCLGYVTRVVELEFNKDVKNTKFYLDQDNLTLSTVVVTAQENSNSATTSHTIDKTALDHVQVMNVSDISSLLPGGATPTSQSLTTTQMFNIRTGGNTEGGNTAFGTAVEVDGARLSNNASFSLGDGSNTNIKGVSTNNIASSNIESVEVITGVPSVEYGDMTSGIVKINTKKGKTPFMVTMSTSPENKQVSVSKGFGLGTGRKGNSNGVLNTSLEYTRSISEQMSPYTSYDRKQLSLTYSNTFSSGALKSQPIRFSVSLTGNLGGLDDKADPDKHRNTYTKVNDNSVRSNFSFNWLLSKSWITNLELNGSLVYSDKLSRVNSDYSSSVTTSAIHSRTLGYHMAEEYKPGGENDVVMIPSGYWYNELCTDDRPLNTKLTLKGNWAKNFGKVNNKVKLGADWTSDKNFGVGQYTEDMATAPTFREYRYCDIPTMHNVAIYLEDNLMIPFSDDNRLNLIAGVRNDNTFIKGSVYGNTSSLSPRFNGKWSVFSEKTHGDKLFRSLSFRASWGVAVKQPSFGILYPVPSYSDVNVFSSTVSSQNTMYRAYFTIPYTVEYNPELRWQKNHQSEVGVDFNIGGNKISLSGYYNKTYDAYDKVYDYESLNYKYTSLTAVQGCSIPAENRVYTIGSDGVITINDKTGAMAPQKASYDEKTRLVRKYTEDNYDSPIQRYGIEWIVEFARIKPINTSIRLDGTYYGYRSLYTDVRAYSTESSIGSDGNPYKYVGYFYGDHATFNGTETKALRNNVTITTNIPKVRMVISLKVEASLLKYSRCLSERADGSPRSYVLSDKEDILSFTGASVYDGEAYTVTFPDYYTSVDDPTPKPFLEMFQWARNNDKSLYADLTKLAVPTAFLYQFTKDYVAPYFSANFSVTKEIGDVASISFYANNFFNNMSQVYSSKTQTYTSVSSYIPKFYYGLTLRLKF